MTRSTRKSHPSVISGRATWAQPHWTLLMTWNILLGVYSTRIPSSPSRATTSWPSRKLRCIKCAIRKRRVSIARKRRIDSRACRPASRPSSNSTVSFKLRMPNYARRTRCLRSNLTTFRSCSLRVPSPLRARRVRAVLESDEAVALLGL